MSKSEVKFSPQFWNPSTCSMEFTLDCVNCHPLVYTKIYDEMESLHCEKRCDLKLNNRKLTEPYKWKTPRYVRINPLTDLFLDKIPDEFIMKVFNIISETPSHIYQIQTVCPERMLLWLKNIYKRPIPDNVWLGVSVEDDTAKDRISLLKQTSAKVKFISFTPLLSNIELTEEILQGIDWVVVGKRIEQECSQEDSQLNDLWIETLYDMCKKLNILIF